MECKCADCKIEPMIRSGQMVDGYWKQIFVCNDPNSPHYKQDIYELDIDVNDNTKVIKKILG